MSNKKRILVLTSTFPRWQGDTEPPFVFELCKQLSEQFDVLVLAPHTDGSRRLEEMEGVNVVRFRYFFAKWERLAYRGGILANLKTCPWLYLLIPFFFVAQLASLKRVHALHPVDAIHAHWIVPQGLTVAVAALLTRKFPPWICTSHGGDLMGLNGRLLNWVKRWVIRSSSFLTVVSRPMEQHAFALGADRRRLRVVSMGVDTRSLFTPDTAILRANNEILFVGRLVEKKGCRFLIEAMPQILDRFPSARLTIVGSGPERSVLEQLSNRLGVEGSVNFCGAMSNSEIPDLFRQASIFVAPSVATKHGDQEGLGLVLVEAMACECPVVATDLPAIRDFVVDRVSGLICKQKDSSNLADSISELLGKPELRRAIGIAGRLHVEDRFDWAAIAHQYATLLNDLVDPRI